MIVPGAADDYVTVVISGQNIVVCRTGQVLDPGKGVAAGADGILSDRIAGGIYCSQRDRDPG